MDEPTTADAIIDELAAEQQAEKDQAAAEEQIEQGAVINPVIRQGVYNDRARRLR